MRSIGYASPREIHLENVRTVSKECIPRADTCWALALTPGSAYVPAMARRFLAPWKAVATPGGRFCVEDATDRPPAYVHGREDHSAGSHIPRRTRRGALPPTPRSCRNCCGVIDGPRRPGEAGRPRWGARTSSNRRRSASHAPSVGRGIGRCNAPNSAALRSGFLLIPHIIFGTVAIVSRRVAPFVA